MTIGERLTRCRLIEKIERNEEYAKRLGISNHSIFCKNFKESFEKKK